MSDRKDHYKNILLQGYIPKPVFAEIATGNWIYALAFAIRAHHGNSLDDWKNSLNSHFNKIQNSKVPIELPTVLRSLSQGMALTMSLKNRAEADFSPWNTVGLISDFYYSITNLLDVIIVGQTDKCSLTHTGRINQFEGLKKVFPHPFNMHTTFNPGLWNGSQLITKEHFSSCLPSKNVSIDSASESSINKWHADFTENIANDVLLGYLRGTTGFYWELTCEQYRKEKKIENFRAKASRDGINPTLKNGNVNFLDCLFRYRTKAHYRDFIYLTNSCFEDSIHKTNTYIDSKFTQALFEISYFATCTAIRYLEAKLGKTEAHAALDAIKESLKERDVDLWNGYNKVVRISKVTDFT